MNWSAMKKEAQQIIESTKAELANPRRRKNLDARRIATIAAYREQIEQIDKIACAA